MLFHYLKQTDEHGIFEANKDTTETIPVHNIAQAVNAASLQPAFLETKRCSKAKGSRHVKPGTLEPNAG